MPFLPFDALRRSTRRRRPSAGTAPSAPTPSPGDEPTLADEVEAFVNGRFAELLTARGRRVPPWAVLNRLAHADLEQLNRVTRGDHVAQGDARDRTVEAAPLDRSDSAG